MVLTDPALNDTSRCPQLHGSARLVFLLLAGVFFVLACAGVLIPGLPTTPFLLLTGCLLVRSSPRLNSRLLRSRFFGPIMIDWQIHGGIRKDVKVKAVAGVIVAVMVTVYLSAAAWQSILAGVLASVGIAVIACVPVAKRGDPRERQ